MEFTLTAGLPTRSPDGADTAFDINFGHGGNTAHRPRLLQTQQRQQNAAGMDFSITHGSCLKRSKQIFLTLCRVLKTYSYVYELQYNDRETNQIPTAETTPASETEAKRSGRGWVRGGGDICYY